MKPQTITDWLALYGACVSTFAICWAIYQWWTRGPRLAGHSSANVVFINSSTVQSQQKHIFVTVSNRGNEPTTITNLALLGYNTWVQYLRDRPSFTAVIPNGLSGYPLPGPLPVGSEWRSMCVQNAELEQHTRSKVMCFAIYHTFSQKAYRVRIPPIR